MSEEKEIKPLKTPLIDTALRIGQRFAARVEPTVKKLQNSMAKNMKGNKGFLKIDPGEKKTFPVNTPIRDSIAQRIQTTKVDTQSKPLVEENPPNNPIEEEESPTERRKRVRSMQHISVDFF